MLMLPRGFAKHGGSAHVGLDEREGIHERAVHVRLGGEVHDRIRLPGQRVHQSCVADVAMDEPISLRALELEQVRSIARVRELVEDGDLDVRPRAAKQADEVGPDETGGARDQQPLQRAAHLMTGAVQS